MNIDMVVFDPFSASTLLQICWAQITCYILNIYWQNARYPKTIVDDCDAIKAGHYGSNN